MLATLYQCIALFKALNSNFIHHKKWSLYSIFKHTQIHCGLHMRTERNPCVLGIYIVLLQWRIRSILDQCLTIIKSWNTMGCLHKDILAVETIWSFSVHLALSVLTSSGFPNLKQMCLSALLSKSLLSLDATVLI